LRFHRYAAGYDDGARATTAHYAKLVAEYETLLAKKTAECEEMTRRADLLMDKLLEHTGNRSLSAAGRAHDAAERASTQQFLENYDADPFAEVSVEQSRYASAADAMIDPTAVEEELH
jgi:hypothetical protein